MSETVTEESKFRGWEPFDKLVELLAKKGIARVYIIATACGMNSPKSTANKLLAFASTHKGVRYVGLEHEEWGSYSKGKTRIVQTPALTVLVKNATAFMKLWAEACKIRSRGCGCSVFISDGQATEVQVMEKEYMTGGDTRDRYLRDEVIYE